MKSNSKQVRDAAKAYLIECIMSPDYMELDALSNKLEDRLINIGMEFKNWYSPYQQRITPNLQDSFIEFFKCLPTCLPLDFYTFEIVNRLTEWGLPNDKGYSEDKSEALFYHIIYSELSKLFTSNGIEL